MYHQLSLRLAAKPQPVDKRGAASIDEPIDEGSVLNALRLYFGQAQPPRHGRDAGPIRSHLPLKVNTARCSCPPIFRFFPLWQ